MEMFRLSNTHDGSMARGCTFTDPWMVVIYMVNVGINMLLHGWYGIILSPAGYFYLI